MSYIDWSQQEFGIAAALSQDQEMMTAYASGDPYLEFARQAGAVPADATKTTHEAERERFKACTLAVQYGMGARSLAKKVGQTPAHAGALLRTPRQTYPRFWAWNEAALGQAVEDRRLVATFGWQIHLRSKINERSVRNFPMQANGAEMMRIACVLADKAGVKICAPVHDAFLIEAALDVLPVAERKMQECMAEASRIVLRGFELRSECKRITYPERYRDKRGVELWSLVQELLSGSPITGDVTPALIESAQTLTCPIY